MDDKQYTCRWCRPESEDERRALITETNLTGSADQSRKVKKHTEGNSNSPLNGVFDKPDYDSYESSLEHTNVSGSQVSTPGMPAPAIVHVPPTSPGRLETYGEAVGRAGSRTVVRPDRPDRIHGFPSGDPPEGVTCCKCGNVVDFTGRS